MPLGFGGIFKSFSWSPQSLGGLTLWLTGNSVSGSNWNDLSGKGNNASLIGTPTITANAINGHPGVTFNGSSQYASLPGTEVNYSSTTSNSIFAAVIPITASSANGQNYFFTDTGADLILMYKSAPNDFYYLPNGSQVTTLPSWVANTPYILHGRWSQGSGGTAMNGSINGNAETSAAANTANNVTHACFIASSTGLVNFGNFTLCELFIYNTDIGTAGTASALAYLRSKYATY